MPSPFIDQDDCSLAPGADADPFPAAEVNLRDPVDAAKSELTAPSPVLTDTVHVAAVKADTKSEAPTDGPADGSVLEGHDHRAKRVRFTGFDAELSIDAILQEKLDHIQRMQHALQQQVLGQDEHCRIISQIVCCALARRRSFSGPLASFFLAGPRGVGKKALAGVAGLFLSDSEKTCFSLDMGVYNSSFAAAHLGHELALIVGQTPPGRLPMHGRHETPFVIVLGDIDKAHPDVRALILEVMDKGVLTDADGNQTSFKNTVICLTSHFGCEKMYEAGATHPDGSVTAHTRREILAGLELAVTRELLYRLDQCLVLNILTPDVVKGIVRLQVESLQKWLVPDKIKLEVKPIAQSLIARKYFKEDAGIPGMVKAIKFHIADRIDRKVDRREIHEGDLVKISVENDGLAMCHQHALSAEA